MQNFLVRISFAAKFGCIFILSSCGLITSVSATVLIEVDLSRQRMFVHSSRANYTWPVSTARSGCIRLAPGNAKLLYEMVEAEGALITITGMPPSNTYDSKTTGAGRSESRRIGVVDEGVDLFTPEF